MKIELTFKWIFNHRCQSHQKPLSMCVYIYIYIYIHTHRPIKISLKPSETTEKRNEYK